mgnify:CR=1 FL=1
MIRKATYDDVPALMEIFRKARGIMRESGNLHQWNEGYPSEDVVRKDISAGHCFVLTAGGRNFDAGPEAGEELLATMAFIPGPDPTYAAIYDGCWPDDSPYHVIHRIAVDEPGHDAARRLLDWGFAQTRCIRIDTHRDNVIMHHILQKYGFIRCGIIHLANGDPRDAYHLNRSDGDK